MNYGFLIDTRSCIGCHACSTACKSENQVPIGVNRTWVKYTEKGRFPDVARHFQVTRCNHCANPPCVRICPVTAMYQRDDGIVEFDPDVCIGCKGCIQACPYDAIYIDPESHTAAKCHFCAHRVDVGQEPACVVVCPEHAILAGDLDDPNSEISRRIAREAVTVRKPEQGTAPKLFYIEGNEVALHPTALEDHGQYMFADVKHEDHGPHAEVIKVLPGTADRKSNSGEPLRQGQPQGQPTAGPVQIGGNMAGHMVQVGWNAQHKLYWHWQIPAYLVTKGAGGGVIIALALAALATTGTSGAFALGGFASVLLMLVTTGLLLIDLDRPDRFLSLLLRPQWRSWIARAAWILSSFSIVSGLWWALETAAVMGIIDAPSFGLRAALAVVTIPLGVLTGTYTAFLFAQAEGRDMWQSPVTAVHMLLQTTYLGALLAVSAGAITGLPDGWSQGLMTTAAAALVLSGLAMLAELHVPRASEIAGRAQKAMRAGEWKQHVWIGGLVLGHLVPLAFLVTGVAGLAPFALLAAGAGMYAYELAYVTAPQRIPNS